MTKSPSNLSGVCGKPWYPNTVQEFFLTAQLGCASLALFTGLTGPG